MALKESSTSAKIFYHNVYIMSCNNRIELEWDSTLKGQISMCDKPISQVWVYSWAINKLDLSIYLW